MTKFYFDPFVDQHVGINGHAHREHDTGDTGKCKGGVELPQNTQDEKDIKQQGDIGHPASFGVIDDNKEPNNEKATYHGKQPLIFGGLAQRGANDTFLYDFSWRWQRSGFQYQGKVFCFLNGKTSRDLRIPIGDFALYGWCRINVIIQYDRNPALRLFG